MVLSKVPAFLAYLISYQVASIIRLVIYIGLYDPIEPALTNLYYFPDLSDISTWIMLAKQGSAAIPYQLYVPIFSISFAGAFVTFNDWNNPSMQLQITYSFIYAILALYIIALYMSIPIYDAVPFIELVAGWGIGALFSYVIPLIYSSARYSVPKQTSRPSQPTTPVETPPVETPPVETPIITPTQN